MILLKDDERRETDWTCGRKNSSGKYYAIVDLYMKVREFYFKIWSYTYLIFVHNHHTCQCIWSTSFLKPFHSVQMQIHQYQFFSCPGQSERSAY
jgi:hypothetical protein